MRSDPPRPPGLFHRSYRSRLDAFDSLVRAWTAWADEAGVAPQAQRDVVLILDELFSNIVIHGYQHAPTGEIRVEAAVEDEQVHVTLTDHAPLFNPLQVPEPDTTLSLEARPIGGLGLLFVRRTADELRYWPCEPNTSGPANRLRFTKFLRAPRARSDSAGGFATPASSAD